jgi:hypothetical protein
MDENPKQPWPGQVAELRELDDPAWRDALAASRTVRPPPGTMVFRDGDSCRSQLLVLSGRVQRACVADTAGRACFPARSRPLAVAGTMSHPYNRGHRWLGP